MKLSLFESAILFSFFRDQSPRNLLCLGFLGTKPLTIPSHHPRSQEAKKLFTASDYVKNNKLNENINQK